VTLQELIARFRSEVADEAQPHLWSDSELLTYAVDAQDRLVRATGGIADVTVAAADVGNPVTRLQDLALTANDPYSTISPYVLRIRSARLLTAARDVAIAQEADMPAVTQQDYGWAQGMHFDDTDTGVVTHGVLGVREDKVRWVRVPVEADTCRLHVFRLPFPRIDDQGDALEVREEHHESLLLWMKHRAYSKQDAEARDDKQAAESRAVFMQYCETARQEQERRKYRPRVVQYGGI
jgi:hypothetical protein